MPGDIGKITARPGTSAPVSKVSSAKSQHYEQTSGNYSFSKNNVVGDFILGKTIGEGTFGKVKIAVHRITGEKVAVKILEKSKIVEPSDMRRVNREIKILKRNYHHNVIQLYEVLETSSCVFLVMEHADGGEMFDYIVKHKRLTEKRACYFLRQIIEGVDYLHRIFVTHRDLKPENLLLQSFKCVSTASAQLFDWRIKIVDFGLSNTHEGGRLLQTACGSPCYASPEMIAGHRYIGPVADIWSMGIILYAMICGYLPFEDENTSKLYRKILSGEYQTPNWLSTEVKDLLSQMLCVNPEQRISLSSIRQHAWNKLPFGLSEEEEEDVQQIQTSSNADRRILSQLAVLGMDPEVVLKSLDDKCFSSHTATYHILLNKHRRHYPMEHAQATKILEPVNSGSTDVASNNDDDDGKKKEKHDTDDVTRLAIDNKHTDVHLPLLTDVPVSTSDHAVILSGNANAAIKSIDSKSERKGGVVPIIPKLQLKTELEARNNLDNRVAALAVSGLDANKRRLMMDMQVPSRPHTRQAIVSSVKRPVRAIVETSTNAATTSQTARVDDQVVPISHHHQQVLPNTARQTTVIRKIPVATPIEQLSSKPSVPLNVSTPVPPSSSKPIARPTTGHLNRNSILKKRFIIE